MNDLFNGTNTLFTSIEQGSIVEKTSLNCVDGGSEDPASPNVSSAHLYPLSLNEAAALDWYSDTLQGRLITDRSGNAQRWWLRSTSVTSPLAVAGSESATPGGYLLGDPAQSLGVRPAFNLNTSQVLFTSAAVGGKSAAGMDGKLTAVGTSNTGEWKLTLKDSFNVDLLLTPPTGVSLYGGVLKMHVAPNVSEMTNRYVSAIIKENESGAITHYGRLVKAGADTDVAVEIDLSGIDMTTHTLHLFLEQYNGDGQTDYAGSLQQVSIPDEMKLELVGATAFNFGAVYPDYTQPAAQAVTLRNASPEAIELTASTHLDYDISINGGDPTKRTILNPGESAVLTVQPKAGLGIERYNSSLSVNWGVGNLYFYQTTDLPLGFEVLGAPAAMQSGFDAMKSPTEHGGLTAYSRLYFGMDGASPILWRVLDASTTNTGASGALLLTEDVLSGGSYQYMEWVGNDYLKYSSSPLRAVLETNTDSIRKRFFSDLEQGAMLAATKGASPDSYTAYADDSLNGDKLFTRSKDEAKSSAYFAGDADRVGTNGSGDPQQWWLRSFQGYPNADLVKQTGSLRATTVSIPLSLRPAFNLDTAKVLFATTAGGLGSGGVAPIGTNATGEWKLTLLDESRSFAITAFTQTSDRVTVSVTGAGTGSNEYVSIVVKDSLNHVTHYGRVAAPSGGTGDVTFFLTGVDLTGKTMFVFSEQDNGANKTNFASKLRKLANTTVTSVTVSPATASAVKGTTQRFTATVVGENDPPQTVTWSVSDGSAARAVRLSAATTIDEDGALTIGADETAQTLIVTAVSDLDKTKRGTATVTVGNAIVITRQPAEQRVTEGQQATFSLAAVGDGLTYQWSIDRNDGKGWRVLDGATSASYTTTATTLANDGFRYRCTVKAANGATLDSDIAVLHVTKADIPPKTGDAAPLALWMGLAIAAIMGMGWLGAKKHYSRSL